MCRATSDLPADRACPECDLAAIAILLESSFRFKGHFDTAYHFCHTLSSGASGEPGDSVRCERCGWEMGWKSLSISVCSSC